MGADTGITGNKTSYLVFDLFLLLLIGIGPKIVLAPFLDATKGVEPDTQRKTANTRGTRAVYNKGGADPCKRDAHHCECVHQ